VHIGAQLRAAREARDQQIDAVSAATGIAPNAIVAIEHDAREELPPADVTVGLVRRYAEHVGLDPDLAVAGFLADPEPDPGAVTQEIPLLAALRKESNLLWIGVGALVGLGALVVFGGGLGGGGPDSDGQATEARGARPGAETPSGPSRTTPEAAPETVTPTPPAARRITLTLDAQPGKTVWIVVRQRDWRGTEIFTGIVGGGVTRTVRSNVPVWLSVAWAPNMRVTLNEEPVDLEGGTETFRVTAAGVARLPRS
jgi:transcriptional regulator with XRE-family HTH domain